MELKTLKDFDIDSIGINTTEDIRKEAIKWINRLEEIDNDEEMNTVNYYCLDCKCPVGFKTKHGECSIDNHHKIGFSWEECSDISAIVEFILFFFNIEKKDYAKNYFEVEPYEA